MSPVGDGARGCRAGERPVSCAAPELPEIGPLGRRGSSSPEPEGGPRREKPGEGDEGASAHLWGEQEKGQEAVGGRVRYPGDLWETSGP